MGSCRQAAIALEVDGLELAGCDGPLVGRGSARELLYPFAQPAQFIVGEECQAGAHAVFSAG